MSRANEDAAATSQLVTLWQKIRHAVRIPEGQSLVWWMIGLERGLLRQIIAFAAFLVTFRFLFAWTWSMSLAMILSMFLHECGHAFIFARAGIRHLILFLYPLGAVAAPIDKAEDERSDQLHWNTISWLLQAGPAVNVALMLVFLGAQPLIADAFPPSDASRLLAQFARDMVYVNGLLAIMNLVPLWTLDAGQLFKIIYSSLEEREDNWLTAILVGGSVILLLALIGIPGALDWPVLLVNAITRFGWLVFLIFFALGVLNKQGRDDPLHAFSTQAMNNWQVIVQLVVYIVLVGLTLQVFAGPLG